MLKKKFCTGPWPTSMCRHWKQNQVQENSLDKAMANVGAIIHYKPPRHWDGANIIACLDAQSLVHQIGGGKYGEVKRIHNMH